MQISSKQVVKQILESENPMTILDAPCGNGWLREYLKYDCVIDGIDLYDAPKDGYRKVISQDLDYGLPDELGDYDCVCCCEGIEHFGNPLLFIEKAKGVLKSNGLIVVTTPNVWYPAAKLQYMLRGFFPSFPCLIGKIERGTHMHIMPWSFPHLFLYLKLCGFKDIKLHEEELSKPKHFFERILGIPQRIYAKRKIKKAKTDEERSFWEYTASDASVFGRHLIVTARKE